MTGWLLPILAGSRCAARRHRPAPRSKKWSSPRASPASAAIGTRTSATTPRTRSSRPIAPMGGLCRLEPPQRQARPCCSTTREGSVRDPQVHYDGAQDPLLLPPGRHRLLPPLRDRRRRPRAAAADRRALRRHRADLSARRPDHVLLQPLQPLGELLVHAGGRALRAATATAANIRPISANIEHDNTPWPLPDGRVIYTRWEYVDRSRVVVPPSLDGQPRRHRADGLLRQPAPGHGDDRRQADPRHRARWWPSSRPATARRNTPGRSPIVTPEAGPDDRGVGPADQPRRRLPRSVSALGRLLPGGPGPAHPADGRPRRDAGDSTACRPSWPRRASSATSRGRWRRGRASR